MKINQSRRKMRGSNTYKKVRAKQNPVIVVIIILLCIIVITLSLILIKSRLEESLKNSDTEQGETVNIADLISASSEPSEIVDTSSYLAFEEDTYDYHRGELVVVNNKTEYDFTKETPVSTLLSSANEYYKVSDSSVTLGDTAIKALNNMMKDFCNKTDIDDIMVRAGFRSFDEQNAYFLRKESAVGSDIASTAYEKAGFSDHHTGLGFDISVYTDDGTTLSYDGKDNYSWISDNMYKYGFILRYPGSKSQLTGIDSEVNHLRYVGIPHAYYIVNNGLCLEEYIELIKTSYNLTQKHLIFTFDKKEYEIFYIKASEGDKTTLYAPVDMEYSVSGDNIGGFIVTASRAVK